MCSNRCLTVCIMSLAVMFLHASVLQGQITRVSGYPRYQCRGEHLSFSNAQSGLIVGTYGGYQTFSTKDSGSTWSFFNVDSLRSRAGRLNSITSDSNGYAWCVGEKVAMFTTDHGSSWNQIGYKSTDSIAVQLSKVILNDVCIVGDSMVWIAGEMAHLLFSSDRGATWSRVSRYNSTDGIVTIVQFVSRTHGWVVHQSGSVYETLDGGISWNKAGSDLRYSSIQMVNDTLGWGLSGLELHKTTDGWRTRQTKFQDRVVCGIVFTSHGEKRVWCATLQQICIGRPAQIYSSFDGGESWDTLSDPGSSGYREICAADSNTLYASADQDLFVITNGGRRDTTTGVRGGSPQVDNANFRYDVRTEQLRFSGSEPIHRIIVFNVIGDIIADAEATDGSTLTVLYTGAIPSGTYYLRYHIGARWYTYGIVLAR
jgi:photosystem II stability/assembly factor-like uncharacterized protein